MHKILQRECTKYFKENAQNTSKRMHKILQRECTKYKKK
jgi:hypothetical protein